MTTRAWLKAARPLAHANIAPPIVLGQALAFAAGHGFDPAMAALAHGLGVLDHLAIVFTNDYADRDADALNEAPTPFSGGSRVLQEGSLRPRQLAWAGAIAAALLLAASTGAALWLARPLAPALALAALALLALYSPLRLAYRGHGEILQAMGVGVVLPLFGYYAQAGTLDDVPWPALAPLVLFGFVSNILTALPDTPADRAAKKESWPVRRGEDKARRDALALLGVGIVLATQVTPPLSEAWMAAAFLPPALLAVGALRYVKRAGSSNREDCLRFVVLGAGAMTLLEIGWSVALFASA